MTLHVILRKGHAGHQSFKGSLFQIPTSKIQREKEQEGFPVLTEGCPPEIPEASQQETTLLGDKRVNFTEK